MEKLMNYKDIILKHNESHVSSRAECNIQQRLGNNIFAAPVCCANMKSLLTPEICQIFDSKNWFYIYHRINGPKDVENFVINANNGFSSHPFNIISISVGIGHEWIDLIEKLYQNELKVDYFTIDVALSYNRNIVPILSKIKERFPEAYLIVGNGCTPEWIRWLESLSLGINCAKVGIGVSQSCRTRQYTGFGSTTVSDLIECVSAAKTLDIMSDGGITVDTNGEVWIGDVNKALTLGATFIMSGALFNKCIDSPAIVSGYFGNASLDAKNTIKHIEGANIKVTTNGLTTEKMCDFIEESIKSAVSYAGGNNLDAFNLVEWRLLK